MPETLSTDQRLTPMMEQYRSIKRTLPADTILFFRLGDFYEMFFEDAVRASELLDITLTGRDGGDAGRVPMCGIPYHAFHGYVRTLLDHNLKVAICEQIGDPKASRGLLERRITRIITPATYLDEEAKPATAEYLAALVPAHGAVGLAYLEPSTGEFCAREVRQDRLTSELALLAPREVVLPGAAATQTELTTYLKDTLHASVTVYEDWVFETDEAQERLRETFHLASEGSVPLTDHPLCLRAAGAILYYLRDHFHAALDHIRPPVVLASHDYLLLDRQAQRSLELVANLADRRGATLLACLDRTKTPMGGRALRHWVTHPLLALEEIRWRQAVVETLAKATSTTHAIRSLLDGVRDIERLLSRLNCGVATARDLVALGTFLENIPPLLNTLRGLSEPRLNDLLAALRPFPDLCHVIARGIVDAPPLTVKDGGMIRDGFSTELDELRGLARNGRAWVLAFQQREIERTGIKSLRVKYHQVFGYTIEVTTSNLRLVPPDYQRKQTLANAERFVTPELLEWDEKISGAEDKAKALEYELFNELRGEVLKVLRPLQEAATAIGTLDALQSLALVAMQPGWTKPEVVDSTELTIRGGRHPVVEAMLPFGQFVENDTHLDTDTHQVLILTGPNMAGKSTYVRQVALITLLAQMGACVPARSARIGLVDRIFTRIGASDNLAGGESTFMVEMIETANILQHATSRSLLILDEVGRGTSTFDGVSIAWAICESLVQGPAHPRTLFATHYHELTQLEAHCPRIKNAQMTVKETTGGIVFLRKVVPGGSDRSYGIHVARLAGIPKQVTDRAEEILAVLEKENTQATNIIEGQAVSPISFPVPDLHPILQALRKLPLDQMTPLEALTALAKWQDELQREAPES